MYKLLIGAVAASAAAVYVGSEYERRQLGKELWARATDQPGAEKEALSE